MTVPPPRGCLDAVTGRRLITRYHVRRYPQVSVEKPSKVVKGHFCTTFISRGHLEEKLRSERSKSSIELASQRVTRDGRIRMTVVSKRKRPTRLGGPDPPHLNAVSHSPLQVDPRALVCDADTVLVR